MAFEKLEPLLYLPDDTSFYRSIGDEFHTARIIWRQLALLALPLVFFIPVLVQGGFVWQDDGRVSDNPLLWSWSGLGRAWVQGLGGSYRPMAQTVLCLEHHFSGHTSWVYHLTSILFHGVNAVLLWGVLRRLEIRGAWFAAALFALHPVQVQAVAWVSQQPHLLGAGLCLAAIWAYLRLAEIRPPLPDDLVPKDKREADHFLEDEPETVLYILALVLAVFAILSNGTAIGLPFVLLLLIWWKRGAVSRREWLRLAPFFAIAVVGAVILVRAGLGAVDPGGIAPTLSIAERALVATRGIWAYLLRIVWPYPLLFVYPRWSVSPVEWWQYLFAAGLALVLAIVWAARRYWGRGPLVAMLVYLTLLIPAIWTIMGSSAPSIYLADYLQYLAAAVPLALIASAIVGVVSRPVSPILARCLRAGTAIFALAVLGIFSLLQETSYSSSENLWKATLEQAPTVTVARVQYSTLLIHEGRLQEAMDVLRDAEPSTASDPAMLRAWGQVYLAREQWADAIRSFTEAHKVDPTNREITLGLAVAYSRAGRVDDALRLYSEELARKPDESVYDSIGEILASQGKSDEAIENYHQALKLNSKFVAAKLNLAKVLFDTKRYEEAAKELHGVVAIDPGNFATYAIDASFQLRIGDFAGAEQNSRIAIARNPRSVEAWNYLGVAQYAQGHVREAILSFERALTYKPDYEKARENLEKARRKLASSDG
jgi:tetratricopeptide (TPR) repeat protein